MKSESRAIAWFALLGAVLVAVALVVSRTSSSTGGVSALPAAAPPQDATPTAEGPAEPFAPDSAPHLLQAPTVSKTQIAFTYAGEIWTVPRDGGDARRLVTGQLRNYRPLFSPDGSQIAFTGVLDGNADVYVVPPRAASRAV